MFRVKGLGFWVAAKDPKLLLYGDKNREGGRENLGFGV